MSTKFRALHAKWRALLGDCRGLAFVEFAFLAPIFFLVTFGIIDFGMMMWTSNTVEHAATEGARYAAVRGAGKPSPATLSEIRDYVKDRAIGVNLADGDVSITWTPNNNPGSTVTIEVSTNYTYLIGGLLDFEPLDLEGSSTMVIN